MISGRKNGILLGVFCKIMIGTTLKMTGRMGSTLVGFIGGFRATFGPRVAGSCTGGSFRCLFGLVFCASGVSFCLVCMLTIPVVLGVSSVLRY